MRMPDYTKTGDGPVTIFLLHGSYGAKEYWGPQASFLAELGYRVIAWDAPGYGVSPLPKDLTLETMAAAAAHLVNELGTDKNVVLGHSLGGIIAPKVAELSGRVDALIISSAFASLQEMGEEAVKNF